MKHLKTNLDSNSLISTSCFPKLSTHCTFFRSTGEADPEFDRDFDCELHLFFIQLLRTQISISDSSFPSSKTSFSVASTIS
ncbi:hypothetical protein Hanom_Chr02g00174731 [Helianthus anomalus]